MKKFLGINRNKLNLFQAAKLNNIKKKNRFKIAGKDEEDSITCNSSLTPEAPHTNVALITNTTQNSSHQESETSKSLEIYEEAKENIGHAHEISTHGVKQKGKS